MIGSARWGKSGDGAWVYGYKVHQVVDCLSQITVALKVTFISRHDSKEAVPLMKRVRSLGKKVLYWLGDGAYDCEKIYGDAAQNGERLIAALNRRRSKKILAKTL